MPSPRWWLGRLTMNVWRLPPGSHAFIGALLGGRTIAGAAKSAITTAPSFEIVSNLKLLAEANIVIGSRGRHAREVIA